MFKRFAILALIGAWPLCAQAATEVASGSTRGDLDQAQKDLDAERQKQAGLDEEKHQLEADLQTIQEKLVKSADATQKAEASLSKAEEKLHGLGDQLREKNDALKDRRQKLDALVQAALRLSRTPPEAMVMMQGDVAGTMEAARALKMATDSIRGQTEILGQQLADLQKLKEKVVKNHEALAQKQTALTHEQQALEQRLGERKDLQEKLGQQQQEEAQKLAQLGKKAEDLQDLFSSLAKEAREQFLSGGNVPHGKKGSLRSFTEAKGRIRTPVAGQVVQIFGTSEGRDATSKGIIIATRDGAQVTAPYDGEVVFTGPFLNYGQLVIIRHSDDFHTLLAGLAKIDTGVGQFLLEGEPIGAMGDSESGDRLYVELRKNNQPVDPVPWINGLNKKN